MNPHAASRLLIATALSAALLVDAQTATNTLGGWNQVAVTDHETALLQQALVGESNYHADVTARVCVSEIRSLAQQVVAGTNYRFVVKGCAVNSAQNAGFCADKKRQLWALPGQQQQQQQWPSPGQQQQQPGQGQYPSPGQQQQQLGQGQWTWPGQQQHPQPGQGQWTWPGWQQWSWLWPWQQQQPPSTPCPSKTPVPSQVQTPVPSQVQTPCPTTKTPTPSQVQTPCPTTKTPTPSQVQTPCPTTKTPTPSQVQTPPPTTKTPTPSQVQTPPPTKPQQQQQQKPMLRTNNGKCGDYVITIFEQTWTNTIEVVTIEAA